LDNGKIDLHEIPQIVSLISKIYQKKTTTKINLINIVRYTVEFILDMEMLPYNADLATMKNVIDSFSIDRSIENEYWTRKKRKMVCYVLLAHNP